MYDKIAEHFSHTRYKAWPRIEKFLNGMETGSLVLDVGCGNGKYLNVNPNLFMVGTDRSKGLLDTALEKNANNQLFAADSLRLPVRSSLFDYVISIAVIHHFSNDKLRYIMLSTQTPSNRINFEGASPIRTGPHLCLGFRARVTQVCRAGRVCAMEPPF